MGETYLTIRQVADRFGVSYQTVWQMVKRGEIDSIRIRSVVRIPESAITKFAAGKQQRRPVQP